MTAAYLITGLILLGMLTACGTGYNSGLVAQEWGTAQRTVIANQVLNPDAAKNLEPVAGLSSTAADKTVNKYNKEFDKPPQVPVYSLGIATGLGSSAAASPGAHQY